MKISFEFANSFFSPVAVITTCSVGKGIMLNTALEIHAETAIQKTRLAMRTFGACFILPK